MKKYTAQKRCGSYAAEAGIVGCSRARHVRSGGKKGERGEAMSAKQADYNMTEAQRMLLVEGSKGGMAAGQHSP